MWFCKKWYFDGNLNYDLLSIMLVLLIIDFRVKKGNVDI